MMINKRQHHVIGEGFEHISQNAISYPSGWRDGNGHPMHQRDKRAEHVYIAEQAERSAICWEAGHGHGSYAVVHVELMLGEVQRYRAVCKRCGELPALRSESFAKIGERAEGHRRYGECVAWRGARFEREMSNANCTAIGSR